MNRSGNGLEAAWSLFGLGAALLLRHWCWALDGLVARAPSPWLNSAYVRNDYIWPDHGRCHNLHTRVLAQGYPPQYQKYSFNPSVQNSVTVRT